MAKECIPGRVKTRLHPPYTLAEAAEVAAASLADTIAAANGWRADRRVLCFDGERPPEAAAGWDVVPQVEGSLDARIAAVLDACTGPTVLIGMDTPQVRVDHLPPSTWFDHPDHTDAWLGAAADGGYWALALAEPRGDLVRGVPMSRADTGRRQRARLVQAGLRVSDLPTLVDIDDATTLHQVSSTMRRGALPRTVAEIDARTTEVA